jgi:uracil-DNA glycosylase family 4
MMPEPHSLEFLNETIIACRLCPRLADWREQVARTKRKAYAADDYWGRPVPGFGDPHARVMAVGLAPGAHGSNRTGRQFTGDASGNFLFPALFRAGFASRPESSSRNDGLELRDLYITAAARCAPPGNKPLPGELNNCQPYLVRELELIRPEVIVALGRIAFERILRIYRRQPSSMDFSHGAAYQLDGDEQAPKAGQRPLPTARWLLASYHPSQQNTLTGRLTVDMFDAIWERAKGLIG